MPTGHQETSFLTMNGETELNTSFVAKIGSDNLTFDFQNHVMCVVGNSLPEKILYVFVFP